MSFIEKSQESELRKQTVKQNFILNLKKTS